MPGDMQISSGTDWSNVVNQLNVGKMDTTTYRKGVGSLMKESEEDEKQIKSLGTAAPPQLEPQPKAEDFKTDPMQTFGSFAMVMATLGSALTRHPLMSALNAGAEIYKAKNQGDMQSYNDAFNKWKINAENAWKTAEWQRNQINDIYTRLKGDEEEKRIQLDLLAKSTDDPSLKAAKDSLEYDNLKVSKEKNTLELGNAIEEANAKQKILEGKQADYLEKHPTKPDGTPMTLKDIPAKDAGEIFKAAESDWASAKKGAKASDMGVTAPSPNFGFEVKPMSKDALKSNIDVDKKRRENQVNAGYHVANIQTSLDSMRSQLKNVTTGAYGQFRRDLYKGANLNSLGSLYDQKAVASDLFDKNAYDAIVEFSQLAREPGTRGTNLQLQTMIRGKPGIELVNKANESIIGELQGRVDDFQLRRKSQDIFRQANPQGFADERAEDIYEALKKNFPLLEPISDKHGNTLVKYNPENAKKIEALLPAAIAHPEIFSKAKMAPDGHLYIPDEDHAGKFLRVDQ